MGQRESGGIAGMVRALRDVVRPRALCLRTLGWWAAAREAGAWCTGRTVLHTVTRHDCAHPFRLRLPSSDVPTCRQVFVKDEYDFVAERPLRTIVDAGANIGLASIRFANRFPAARIVAIEPEAANFALLCENVAPYPNIIPVQAALWCTDGEIELVDPGLGHWGYMVDAPAATTHLSTRVCHRVPSVTVGALLEAHGLGRIDLLKVDIEGAEREVFADTTGWIDRVDAIIVEEHDRLKPGCRSSVERGVPGFAERWQQGENLFFVRDGRITRRASPASNRQAPFKRRRATPHRPPQ
jgi:FkbM family methyltransferase